MSAEQIREGCATKLFRITTAIQVSALAIAEGHPSEIAGECRALLAAQKELGEAIARIKATLRAVAA